MANKSGPDSSTPLKNRSQLGDPVSLKAETSKTSLTEHDRPNDKQSQQGKEASLKELAQQKIKSNPSQLGDPISLKAETSTREPTEEDRGAASDREAVEYDREADRRAKKEGAGRSKL
ncbi:MAG: hypothetical protein Q9165_002126 [Trypethelium subeluteriae]